MRLPGSQTIDACMPSWAEEQDMGLEFQRRGKAIHRKIRRTDICHIIQVSLSDKKVTSGSSIISGPGSLLF